MLLSSGQPAQRRLDFGRETPAEPAARSRGTPGTGCVQRADTIAGTRVRIEAWAEQRRAGEAACAAALAELRRFARLGSSLGEGHAADHALALLRRHGVRQARVDVGAAVRRVGAEPASGVAALAV